MYWNDHTVLDSDDDDDDDVKGQIVDVNAKSFLFQGGVNVAEKLLTLRVSPFHKYSSRNIYREISFLTRASSLLDSKTACVAYKLCVR